MKKAALFFLAAFNFVTLPALDVSAGPICEVTSPVDGSVWTGTAGEGLIRTGRNGKVIQYGLSSGQLGSDTIYSLFFDADDVLWILDASMRLSTYSSTWGFAAVRDSVSFLSANSSDGAVYYTVGDTLFSAKNGKIAAVLFSPDFDFPAPQPVPPQKSDSHGLPFYVCILAFLAGCVISYIIYRLTGSRKKAAPKTVFVPVSVPAPAPTPAPTPAPALVPAPIVSVQQDVPVIQPEEPSEPVETVQEEVKPKIVNEPGEFTKLVIGLVKEHLSDPDFGVETIAEITGMSRIHVNRKLKSEGAPAPSVMVKKERMDKAEQLLRSGQYSIADISKLCGFRTPAYFATAFKEFFGCTPTDFLSK